MHWFLILDAHRYAFTGITSDAAAAAAEFCVLYGCQAASLHQIVTIL